MSARDGRRSPGSLRRCAGLCQRGKRCTQVPVPRLHGGSPRCDGQPHTSVMQLEPRSKQRISHRGGSGARRLDSREAMSTEAWAAASRVSEVRGTRQELELKLPRGALQCIDAHQADHSNTRFVAMKRIADKSNPAFREDGSGKMCVATQDLEDGCFIACFPGSGQQTMRQPCSAYEESYCFELAQDAGRLIPTEENNNALSSLNDFRTNIAQPSGPQGRACSVDNCEIWMDGKAYLLFFTLRPVSRGEELLWDYGADYWSDREGAAFRSQDLATQERNWTSFREERNVRDFKHAAAVQVKGVVCLGSVWLGLLAMGRPQLAAAFLCIGMAVYAKFIVERSQNRPV